MDNRGAAKKSGQKAAKSWCQTATLTDQIALAGCDFVYGDTLTDLIADNYVVPASVDTDFSWGFFKQVKGHVHHAMHTQSRMRDGKNQT